LAKRLIISTESTIEILRLSPQNDIATQSLQGVGVDKTNLLRFSRHSYTYSVYFL
jgi:hypothetical protein